MKFTNRFRVMAMAALAAVGIAGVALAQGPGGGNRPPFGSGGPFSGGGPGGMLMGMMGHALDLTDAQKSQIQTIVQSAFQTNQATINQLKTLREQEIAALKAGKSEQELRTLAQTASPVITQLHAAKLVTEAKVYAVLTPAQREKLDKMRTTMRERFQRHGFGPPAIE